MSTLQHRRSNREEQHCDGYSRSTRRRNRIFIYRRKRQRLSQWAVVLLVMLFIVGAFNIVSYAVDYYKSQQASAALREAYYSDELTETVSPTQVPQETPVPVVTPMPFPTPQVTATPPIKLEAVRYPGNYYANISSRFQKIRRQNKDIIGWLTIDNLIDEAVVQHDNEFYLDRDYRGYHNVNGAIFLDESCDLSTRPYTLMLYGHNMKSGAMFGNLRNYENLTYYKNNPFITFDTAYEEGRYVIFAVGTVSTRSSSWQYVDFSKLCSNTICYREEALKTLTRRSIYSSTIEVSADDQLLLLITCVDDDEERRVIVARRIREDETEDELNKVVKRTTRK